MTTMISDSNNEEYNGWDMMTSTKTTSLSKDTTFIDPCNPAYRPFMKRDFRPGVTFGDWARAEIAAFIYYGVSDPEERPTCYQYASALEKIILDGSENTYFDRDIETPYEASGLALDLGIRGIAKVMPELKAKGF